MLLQRDVDLCSGLCIYYIFNISWRACRAKELLGPLADHQASGFAYPKTFRMSLYPYTIRALGSAQYTSTSFGERAHGFWNEAQNFTNRHEGAATGQV